MSSDRQDGVDGRGEGNGVSPPVEPVPSPVPPVQQSEFPTWSPVPAPTPPAGHEQNPLPMEIRPDVAVVGPKYPTHEIPNYEVGDPVSYRPLPPREFSLTPDQKVQIYCSAILGYVGKVGMGGDHPQRVCDLASELAQRLCKRFEEDMNSPPDEKKK